MDRKCDSVLFMSASLSGPGVYSHLVEVLSSEDMSFQPHVFTVDLQKVKVAAVLE